MAAVRIAAGVLLVGWSSLAAQPANTGWPREFKASPKPMPISIERLSAAVELSKIDNDRGACQSRPSAHLRTNQ